MAHPDGEAQKRVYESLSAVCLRLEGEGYESTAEEALELARTLAKGGPYAATVERWARDHGHAARS